MAGTPLANPFGFGAFQAHPPVAPAAAPAGFNFSAPPLPRLFETPAMADLVLVTKKGTRFRVRRKYMEVHSGLFDDMAGLTADTDQAGEDTYKLPDPDVGDAELDMLLTLIHGGALPDRSGRWLAVYKAAYALAAKWNCSQLIINALRTAFLLEPSWASLDLFELAAQHSDWELLSFAAPEAIEHTQLAQRVTSGSWKNVHDLRQEYSSDGALALYAAAMNLPGKVDRRLAKALQVLVVALQNMNNNHVSASGVGCETSGHLLKYIDSTLGEPLRCASRIESRMTVELDMLSKGKWKGATTDECYKRCGRIIYKKALQDALRELRGLNDIS